MIDENKYKNEMSSLEKAKAPRGFLAQVDKRLGQRKKVFFPAPMRLATAVAAILIIFTVYKVSQQPMQVAYVKEPGTKMERAERKKLAVVGSRQKAVGTRPKAKKARSAAGVAKGAAPIAEEQPIEIALSLKSELAGVMGEAADEMAMDMAPASSMMGAGARIPVQPVDENIAKVKELIRQAQGKVLSVEKDSITAEVPADSYASLLKKLETLGELQKPLPAVAPANKKLIKFRLKLLP